eukprot:UN04774
MDYIGNSFCCCMMYIERTLLYGGMAILSGASRAILKERVHLPKWTTVNLSR